MITMFGVIAKAFLDDFYEGSPSALTSVIYVQWIKLPIKLVFPCVNKLKARLSGNLDWNKRNLIHSQMKIVFHMGNARFELRHIGENFEDETILQFGFWIPIAAKYPVGP